MKKILKFVPYIFLFALVFSLSCKKDKDDSPETDSTTKDTVNTDTVTVDTTNNSKECTIIKAKISTQNNSLGFIRTYKYNTNTQLLEEVNDDDGESWKLSYDNSGKLIRVDFNYSDDSKEYEEYLYNSKGQVNKVKRYKKNSTKKWDHQKIKPRNRFSNFDYKNEKKIEKSNLSGFELDNWSTYEYNDSGWISQENTFLVNGSLFSETKYSYDDNGNATKSEQYIDMMLTGNLELFSRTTVKYEESLSPMTSLNKLPRAFLGVIGMINFYKEVKTEVNGNVFENFYVNETNEYNYVTRSVEQGVSEGNFEFTCQ